MLIKIYITIAHNYSVRLIHLENDGLSWLNWTKVTQVTFKIHWLLLHFDRLFQSVWEEIVETKMLFTLLMRDEFIFYKTTKSSLQLLPSPYTVAGSVSAAAQSGEAPVPQAVSQELLCWHLNPSPSLCKGGTSSQFRILLLLWHCLSAALLIKYLHYYKIICVQPKMWLAAAASGRALNIIWRELKTTCTASQWLLSSALHIYPRKISATSVQICFSSLSSQASEMVPNLTAN